MTPAPVHLKNEREYKRLTQNISGKKERKPKSEIESLVIAARGLVQYRKLAGPLGFQLEKADYFINEMQIALEKMK